MSDAILELIIKVLLALVILWFFQRLAWWLAWLIQPFMAGFAAGVLVTLLFIIRLRRS
jgi:hypothetical protein